MIISFTLNGKKVSVNTPSEKRLIYILREDFKLLETKSGCNCGKCGNCYILLNGELVCSCLIPAFNAKNETVITIEGFSKTAEYKLIVKSLEKAGYNTDSEAISAKILAIHALLEMNSEPDESEIMQVLSAIPTDYENYNSLISGIKNAGLLKKRLNHAG